MDWYQRSTHSRRPPSQSLHPLPRAGPDVGTDVIAIDEDRSGNLWVGTYSHGLLRFDRRTEKFKTYQHNPADPYSLSNDIVSRLLVDHNGTLWAATWDGLDSFRRRDGALHNL